MDVIATIHKNPYHTDRNQKMIEAGVDVFRIKCSHFGVEDIAKHLMLAREQINASGRKVKILADLPEAKIRLGIFPIETVNVVPGDVFTFTFGENTPDIKRFVPVRYRNLGLLVKVGEHFFIGDGLVGMEVRRIIDNDTFEAVSLNTGRMIQCHPLTFPSFMDSLDHITPFLDEIIAILPQSKPEMVSFSFVSSRAMLDRLIGKLLPLTSADWHPMIIAKIESQGGVDHIDEILPAVQGIMVARGDLALNVPFQKVGMIQKMLVAKARQANKYVIVSTGMLQSLLDNYLPMRSDILDLTNACLDGASAVMLCSETAHSPTPERTIQVAKAIIAEVEGTR